MMKKPTAQAEPNEAATDAAATEAPAQTEATTKSDAAATGDVAEPDHPMPHEGGSYIRQPNGSLVRQDEPEQKDA